MTRPRVMPRRGLAVTLSALSAILLAVFGVTWWLGPERNALIFGVPLSGATVVYGRVKGTQDLLAAAVLGCGIALRDDRARLAALALGSLVPLGDLLALLSVGVTQLSVVWIHVAFIVVMGASASLLRLERNQT